MPVHDIDMDPVGAGLVDRAHLLAELGKIGGEDRRGDDERPMHEGTPMLRGSPNTSGLSRQRAALRPGKICRLL